MSMIPIRTIPDPVLNKKTGKVHKIDDTIKNLAQDLLDTVKAAKEPEGAGLAATQIGVSKRVCVVRKFIPDPQDKEKLLIQEYILINPKISSASEETEIAWKAVLAFQMSTARLSVPKK